MQKITIVTDSTADLTPQEIEDLGIVVVPLTITLNDQHFLDGETITKEEFLQAMIQSSQLPKTAQPAIGRFVEVYDALGQDQGQVLSLHLMHSISGTVDAARQASHMSQTPVTVLDSDFTSRSMGIMVKELAKAAQEGQDMDQLVSLFHSLKDRTKLYLTVLELDNLIKGGRISRLMGAFSNLLNIKLFLEVTNGKIEIIQKGRGQKSLQAKYNEIIQEMQASLKGIKEIGIMHAGLNAFNQGIIDEVRRLFPQVPIEIVLTSPIIMTHTGANAMAITYLENE